MPLFAAIEKVTVALPVPLAPDVIVIQLALLVAVRPHELAEAVAVTLPVVTLALTEKLVGETVNEQVGAVVVAG